MVTYAVDFLTFEWNLAYEQKEMNDFWDQEMTPHYYKAK